MVAVGVVEVKSDDNELKETETIGKILSMAVVVDM